MANAGILIPVIRYPLSVSVIRIFGSVNLGYSNYYINTINDTFCSAFLRLDTHNVQNLKTFFRML